MKKLILVMFALLPLGLCAQELKLDKYPSIPDALNLAFCDYCSPFASGVLTTSYGQFFGQVNPHKSPYGYGQYLMNDGLTITGQFRDGTFFFGIMMGTHIVKVGTPSHYISYDLTNGSPISVTKDSVTVTVSSADSEKYKFVSYSYPSGDRYVGETVNGKRHGFGIYHYKNGDFYYGLYRDNDRYGCGALFRTNRKITIQHF